MQNLNAKKIQNLNVIDSTREVKSTQEQAVASWITYLNQIRIDELKEKLFQQDINLESALAELAELKEFVGNPIHILGSPATKHGEIAEHVQVNFSNARRVLEGLDKQYTFEGVGRTAPEDYLFAGNAVQSKFYNGAKNTLNAVEKHLETYPDFVRNGGSYDIPKDQYEQLQKLLELSKTNPSQLSRADWKLVEAVKRFQEKTGLDFAKDVNSAVADYGAVQQGKVGETINTEETNIHQRDDELRNKAYKDAGPSFQEGLKVTAVSAAIEGGVAFCMAVAEMRKSGKKISEFTTDDWKAIGIETGVGTLKGGVRGSTVYVLTNFTATPANVASAFVTAVFGVSAQLKAYERGEISDEDFIINCESVCLDVTVSAISSLIGEMVIPIPFLGAIIGNVVGEFVYGICKQRADEKEMMLIAGYKQQLDELNQQLDMQLKQLIVRIEREINRFKSLEALAFDENINIAFQGSIQMAREVGVKSHQILRNMDDINNYFLV